MRRKQDVYKRQGIWPFMALQVLVFVLCILFPQIVTWLPGHMIG